MAVSEELLLPRLGETMDEGTVVAWRKKPGEAFKRGEVIAEIESDKTVVEMPALQDGRLEKILAPAGTKLAVGAPLALISGAKAAKGSKPAKAARPAGKDAAAKPARSRKATAKKPAAPAKGAPLGSPNSRRLAKEGGVDLATVKGTGRGGRITGANVVAAAAAQSAAHVSHLFIERWRPRRSSRQLPWLLIHGLFGSSKSWSGLAAMLTDAGAPVYAIDLPGHGKSQAAGDFGIASIARDVIESLRSKVEGPVRLAGISLGAAVAAEMATIDDGVDELCLIAPAGLGEAVNRSFIDRMIAAARGADIHPALELLGPGASALGDKAAGAMQDEIRERAEALEQMAEAWFPQGRQAIDIRPALGRVEAPARALFGLDDQILPWQDATRLPDHVGAHFLAGAGHMPHLDRPDRVLAFLQGTEERQK
ncbi:MAG: alpha/beta fold hydrolase [Betaproteobacteria bacterium AqS2]|uniref:Alpha/beta fold hydrolase n=1 Tax=Candidatus Amphirhobacter heronislandensis TaxID=1732024 RepID=A0A930UF05_9GAMM|nr:alpha/beta fold hydrolase [Betaproteobacteria bacterium AqS2]